MKNKDKKKVNCNDYLPNTSITIIIRPKEINNFFESKKIIKYLNIEVEALHFNNILSGEDKSKFSPIINKVVKYHKVKIYYKTKLFSDLMVHVYGEIQQKTGYSKKNTFENLFITYTFTDYQYKISLILNIIPLKKSIHDEFMTNTSMRLCATCDILLEEKMADSKFFFWLTCVETGYAILLPSTCFLSKETKNKLLEKTENQKKLILKKKAKLQERLEKSVQNNSQARAIREKWKK